jgi:UDP-N-acetylglucosamine:LPS N-acetylglucosamine transferase
LKTKLSVLITPLDWGLGHATRCIPIITEFLKRGCKVSIATSGGALDLLKKEFPQLIFFELVSYKAEYAMDDRLLTKLFSQSLKFISAIRKEHQQLKQLLKEHRFDLIISDNRFGCYSKDVKSIFITHQINFVLNPSMKWAESIVNYSNQQKIKKFDHCWIPDLPKQNFSGELSTPNRLPVSFIGILSRFKKRSGVLDKKYDLLALISGPEPQRSIFEKIIRDQSVNLDKRILLVKGKPEESEIISIEGPISEAGHLKTKELQEAIEASAFVICRSGYSSIMDLAIIETNNIIFVPTPGQPEQEYLAKKMQAMDWAYAIDQDKLEIIKAINESKNYIGLTVGESNNVLLSKAIEEELNP